MNGKSLILRWLTDYDFKTVLSASASLIFTLIFALYNGFLGIWHQSVWHGSICVYYLLLVCIRGMILLTEKKEHEEEREQEEGRRSRVYLCASLLLLVLNLSLIVPLALLVKQQRNVHLTLIPAIAMAAYAFYKLTLASIHLAKRRKSGNCLVRLLRSINFIDALLSIMTLQNTLIMIHTSGEENTMLGLTAVTSGIMWLMMVILSVSGLVTEMKNRRHT